MNDMPMFDDPIAPPEPPLPKKPRQKPTRKRKVSEAAPKVVKKRRKKRLIRSGFVKKMVPVAEHAGGRYSKDVYVAIGSLMGMKGSDRETVLDIVQGLTNGRAD